MDADATDLAPEFSERYVPELVGQRSFSEPPTPENGVVQGGRRAQLCGVDGRFSEVVDFCFSAGEVLWLSWLLWRERVEHVIFVMIVISHALTRSTGNAESSLRRDKCGG